MMSRKKLTQAGSYTGKSLVALLFFSPFYIALVYAVKSKKELARNRLSFPTKIHWENFALGIKRADFFLALRNSIITTVITVSVLLLICSMAAYVIARRKSKFYSSMYYILLGATLIPFQAIITPLYKQLKMFGMINNLLGFSMVQIAFQVAFTTLVITGFVKTIPLDLEHSARIDGCGQYRTFFTIIFPLMKPILFTVTVLDTLATWNDFQVSVVFLQAPKVKNLAVTQFYFFGKNTSDLNQAFSIFLLSMIPILILYFTLQRYIIDGIVAGAIKG